MRELPPKKPRVLSPKKPRVLPPKKPRVLLKKAKELLKSTARHVRHSLLLLHVPRNTYRGPTWITSAQSVLMNAAPASTRTSRHE